jgi:hypothetical protein
MAKVKNNIVTQGLSGMLGGQLVFRQTSRGTVVSVAPQPAEGPSSAAQIAQRERFQQAIIYAKGRAKDPAVQAEYAADARERNQSVNNVLVADYMHAPNISAVDISTYTGKVGEIIRVTATDDHAVKTVTVKIENGDGTLVEQGPAQRQPDTNLYHYTTTKANATLAGDKITVTATDNPGHAAVKTSVL